MGCAFAGKVRTMICTSIGISRLARMRVRHSASCALVGSFSYSRRYVTSSKSEFRARSSIE